MSPLQRLVSTFVLACFVICSVAWTYDAYAGDDPLLSGQATEPDEDGGPLSGSGLPPLSGGGYCNLGCHLAGHLLGPVSDVPPVVFASSFLLSDRVFCTPAIRFLEPAVPPPVSPSHV